MKSRSHKALLVALVLAMSHVGMAGHGQAPGNPNAFAQTPATVVGAEQVVGGQAIDWVTCTVASIGSIFMPLMGIFAFPICYSAVVRTWG